MTLRQALKIIYNKLFRGVWKDTETLSDFRRDLNNL